MGDKNSFNFRMNIILLQYNIHSKVKRIVLKLSANIVLQLFLMYNSQTVQTWKVVYTLLKWLWYGDISKYYGGIFETKMVKKLVKIVTTVLSFQV